MVGSPDDAGGVAAGADRDNIYTVWNGRDRKCGVIALDSMPRGRADSLLVP